MLETILKVLIVANLLAAFAIWFHIITRQNEVIADQEQRIQRLFSENIALETTAIQNSDFGNDFIKQSVHGEELPDWSLGFETQTDTSTR